MQIFLNRTGAIFHYFSPLPSVDFQAVPPKKLFQVHLRQPRAATPTGENVTESAITANTVETYLRLFEIQPMFTLS